MVAPAATSAAVRLPQPATTAVVARPAGRSFKLAPATQPGLVLHLPKVRGAFAPTPAAAALTSNAGSGLVRQLLLGTAAGHQ